MLFTLAAISSMAHFGIRGSVALLRDNWLLIAVVGIFILLVAPGLVIVLLGPAILVIMETPGLF